MENTKVVIEVRGGIVQAVYASQPLQYVVVDFDNIFYGTPPVGEARTPDIVTEDLHTIHGGDPAGDEIAAALKRIHF
jgi:hypothetical protein